ncbi:MAG TPA: M36 family metallopeptidase [Pyrinomonadaceae bacterium]|nr:M36 family metallopeptidase [Pyrinomonadaceae bacterium]
MKNNRTRRLLGIVLTLVFTLGVFATIGYVPGSFVSAALPDETAVNGQKREFFYPETHFLRNPEGFLTGPTKGEPLDIALQHLRTSSGSLGLLPDDLSDAKVSSMYRDEDTGITHIYLRQMVSGLEVLNGDIGIHVTAKGEVIAVGGGFVPGLKAFADTGSLTRQPHLSAEQAVVRAAELLELSSTSSTELVSSDDKGEKIVIRAKAISLDDIKAELRYVPSNDGAAKLSWGLIIRTPDGQHWYDLSIDATTGEFTSESDWVDNDTYTVAALPSEHPNDGFIRTVTNPANATASPFGWHDTNGVAGGEFTDTRGNNVDAHLDRDANDVADTGSRPDGGAGLNFNAVFDPALTPIESSDAAVTNLFYWNNILHDVHHFYGFTPAAGNFQTNNYGGGGLGNDAVQADAQDGSGTNNANFGTPVDGSAPRMQMYEWTNTTPRRDSDFDNGVIAHEYGHGVSNRLTGGPANANALNNTQSGGMGEGWSDFHALMFTQKATDTKTGGYGIGTYLLGQSASGGGIRAYRYSFDKTLNPIEFDSYGTSGTTSYGLLRSTAVHRSGTVWNSTLWDMNWLLIDKYGFDDNLYTGWTGSGAGGAGNKLAMRLVMDAMKLQPANPSFVQARDAILSADTTLTGGANQCEIWRAFARRGLGFGAVSGASTSTALITVSSALPAVCGLAVTDTTPGSTSVVTTPTTSFVINFSNPVTPASVVASDLQVNGISATSVALSNADQTATFTYGSSPVTAQGVQVMAIAADAITRASDSDGVDAFSRNFRYDSTILSVSSTTPAVSGNFNLPAPLTYDVTFNESISAASVSIDDIGLSTGSVTAATALNATTARYTISGITSETPITIAVDPNKVADLNGNTNTAFQGSYQTDITTIAFPTALQPKTPLGSLIYDGSYAANVSFVADTDAFTISLDAGQTLSVLLSPTNPALQPSVLVTGPGGTNQGNTAAAAGSPAILNSVPIATAGVYTITTSGAASTVGAYDLTLTLNADRESERDNGASNNTTATAQDIDPSFTTQAGGVSKTAVVGQIEVGGADEVEPNGTTATATNVPNPALVPSNLYQLGVSGNISTGSDQDYFDIGTLQAGDVITITQSGSPSGRGTNSDVFVYLYRAGSGTAVVSDDDSGPGLDSLIDRFTITTADTYYVRAYRAGGTGTYQAAVFLENSGTAPTTGGSVVTETEPNESTAAANNLSSSWRAVNYQFTSTGSIAASDTDIFSYTFTAGDLVTLRSTSTSLLAPQSALLNSAGTAISTENGTSAVAGVGGESPHYGYIIPTTGTYYFRNQAFSGTGSYRDDVYVSTASTLTPLPVPSDHYALTLTSGQKLGAVLKSTATNADVDLLNSGGTVVAAGTAGSTNLEKVIAGYTAPSAGTYYLRVSGYTSAEYQLITTKGGAFDAEPNDTFATAQNITGLGGVAGFSSEPDFYSFTGTAGQVVVFYTTTPGDGPNIPSNIFDPKLQLFNPSGTQVASGTVLADGRNERIIYTLLVNGDYRVRVSSQAALGAADGEYFLAFAPNAPTASSVGVSGRVLTNDGAGLRNAVVSLTDMSGNVRQARTGAFGYFSFDEIASGQTYIISIASKRYTFTPRSVTVADEISDLEFVAEP